MEKKNELESSNSPHAERSVNQFTCQAQGSQGHLASLLTQHCSATWRTRRELQLTPEGFLRGHLPSLVPQAQGGWGQAEVLHQNAPMAAENKI